MSLLDHLPGWMKEGGSSDAAADVSPNGDAQPPRPAVPTYHQPPPVPTVTTIGGEAQPVTTGHDPALTSKIITAITEAVPDLQALFAEAEKISGMVKDPAQRITIVMELKGFTPEKAAQVVAGLNTALRDVKAQAEGELAKAKANEVDGPTKQIAGNEATKQKLQAQIETLDKDTSAIRVSVVAATQKIEAEASRLNGSLVQVTAWVNQTAELLGIQH